MEREKLSSRLGFILLSAGCAIGIGNVWRFPYVAGNSGGGLFVLLYLFFLISMGVPIMTMEFAVGRASRKSVIKSYQVLEKPGQKWHLHGILAMAGNYLLMMFYTTVAGWMLHYFYLELTGHFEGMPAEQVSESFGTMLQQPGTMMFWMILVVVVGFGVCSRGLQGGVEKITKYMMIALLGIMVILSVRSIALPGAKDGLAFYLLPNLEQMKAVGFGNAAVAAMNQAFFTLSIGIGAMAIFGSYIGNERSLFGESISVAVLDTFVAITAGLIIFPACFAYDINPGSGPGLIFMTLPNVFTSMPAGRLWGSLFFLFMSFAAFSTIIAVFENIMSFGMDLWGWSRKKTALINIVVVGLASVPCVLGFNLWSGIEPLRAGNTIQDLEDFLVSNILLPGGSLVYLLFCTRRWGWGWKNFIAEANTGKGPKFPNWLRIYASYILPVLLLVVLIYGIITYFM